MTNDTLAAQMTYNKVYEATHNKFVGEIQHITLNKQKKNRMTYDNAADDT